MIGLLLPVWIVAGVAEAPPSVRFSEAATVFYCAFDDDWDRDFDEWPDGWTRRHGPAYPHYVHIQLADGVGRGGRHLRIDLDGGAAAAFTPPVPVDALFGYVLEGRLKTVGLNHDRAYLSITMLDENRRALEAYTSRKVRETDGWQILGIGPFAPKNDRARSAVIGLHVEPTAREDLTGSVLLDDVRLGRLPRMTLRANAPHHFFLQPAEVAVECTVSGEIEGKPQITFRLEDALHRELARLVQPMTVRSAGGRGDLSLEEISGSRRATIAFARFKPPIDEPGFYRVTAAMENSHGPARRTAIPLAIVEPRRPPLGGRFGWSLPQGARPLPSAELSQLVLQAGVHWVKYPVWSDNSQDQDDLQQLVDFVEYLGDHGVQMIGLLAQPPEPIRRHYGANRRLSAADVFAAGPEVWYPSIEPVMARLATRLRWWQLGNDDDSSFAGQAALETTIAQVKGELDRIGRDVNLGLGWTWGEALPEIHDQRPPWSFVSLQAGDSLPAEQLAEQLKASHAGGVRRFVSILPMSRRQHPTAERTTDLIQRMVAAKVHGAEAVFCPDPFHPERGLMNPDGTPGELLLPWRTTALLLGGKEHLGCIELPGGSSNEVFVRGDEAVMVLWNDRPCEEVIYLGDNIRQVDPWGRSTTPADQQHRQVIPVDGLPCFVTGVNAPVARWRMDCQLARERIPSVFGQPHANTLLVKNPFASPVSGHMELVGPSIWLIEPKHGTLQMGGGQSAACPFTVLLPFSADSGRHPLRIDFEIDAARLYQFSVYRRLDVGLGEVRLDVFTRLDSQGNLEVHQFLVNDGDTVASFQCQVYVPGRRRRAAHIVAPPHGRQVHVYRLKDGRELIGQTLWLRAEELGGSRILSRRVTADDGKKSL